MKRIFFIIKNLFSTRFLIKRIQRRFIAEAVHGKHFPAVVDVGAGKAPYKKIISHDKYIGVDVEDRGGVQGVVIGDINERLPIGDEIADLVVCTEVLEHTKKPHVAVRELRRIMKTGGMLVLTAPMTWPVHEAPHDFYRYTRYGLEYLLNDAGFSDVTVKPGNGYFFTVCQLINAPLRNRLFAPLVAIVNIFGLIALRYGKNHNLPIDYQVVAYKK